MQNCGCGKKATHLVQVSPISAIPIEYQEHCTECMLEALCAEPVAVIDLEAWEVKQREQSIAKSA
jgi:hypothetical protein